MHARAAWPFHVRLACAALIALLTGLGAAAFGQEGQPIAKIEIRGLSRVDPARLLGAMRVREGDPYSARIVNEDIRRLYDLGSLAQINVRTEPVGDEVKLVLEVQERPVVTAVRFEGNLAKKRKHLLQHIELKQKQYANPYQLKLDRNSLIEFYREAGYHFAQVQAELAPVEAGVEILYTIEAGPRLKIERIQLEGNDHLKDRDLLKLMTTKAERWFGRGAYDEPLLRSDLQTLRDFYRRKGWLDCTVGKRVVYDDAKERMYVVVQITERHRYILDRIVIRGNRLFTRQELLDAFEHEEGGYFAPEALAKDVRTLRDLYGAQGHIRSRVRAEPIFAETGHRLELHVTITEGPVVYVDEIKIQGLRRTQDRIARRELMQDPGERVNAAKIEESKRRLLRTRLFASDDPTFQRDPVRPRFEDSDRPDRANVIFDLDEGKVGELNFGVGISSAAGLIGQVALTHRNFDPFDTPKSGRDVARADAFAGAGQSLSLKLTPGTRRQDYRLAWHNPRVFDGPYSTGFDLFLRRFFWNDWDEDRIGATVGVGREFFPDFVVTLTPGWEDINISSVDDDAPADAFQVEGHNEKRKLTLAASYDKRDNIWLPTKGYVVTATAENAGWALGGDVDTIKGTLEARRFFPVYEQIGWGTHVVHLGARLGAIDATRGRRVPIFERFFAGGSGSMRGFDSYGIGPVDPATEDHIGGEVLMVANAEYDAPIVGNVLRGVVFVDVGKVDEEITDFNGDDIRVSAGFGIRLRIAAIGMRYIPLTLDIGFPIVKEHTDEREVISFNMGTGFEF